MSATNIDKYIIQALENVDYNSYHVGTASSFLDPDGLDVLVVGCNTGADCQRFLDLGARRVIGIDPIEEVGRDYPDARISYNRGVAEDLPLAAHSVDLAFCFATMEHVAGIEAAYRELERVCRPNGLVYCLAAPLWRARSGPHWGNLFDDLPWAHLRFDKQEVVAAGMARGVPEAQMHYYLGDQCNKRPPVDYIAAAGRLDLEIIRNDLQYDADDPQKDVVDDLYSLGYTRDDLYGSVHTLVARKRLT